ncbi:hypothetical protein D3C78_1027770 [compost metagenome]
MKTDHQALRAEIKAVHPVHQRVEYRNDQQQADHFVQQATQRDLPPRGVLHAGAEKCQHPAADVGANDQANGHWQADHSGTGKGRREQYRRQAGVGNHREQCADQGIEQDVAGQRGKQHLDALGMGDGSRGFDDQLQGQNNQPQANPYPAELACASLLAREKENHAQENQQRRQPGQIQGQDPRHQRGTDIGAEHGCQGRRQCHQALADE